MQLKTSENIMENNNIFLQTCSLGLLHLTPHRCIATDQLQSYWRDLGGESIKYMNMSKTRAQIKVQILFFLNFYRLFVLW